MRYREEASFTLGQHEELEALLSQTMLQNNNLQREPALKLSLQEKPGKAGPSGVCWFWFRNRRFKSRKQQQQNSPLKPPNQILAAEKNVPTSPSIVNPYSFSPVAPGFNPLLPQPASPSSWSGHYLHGVPQENLKCKTLSWRLVDSVPALNSDACEAQILELSFPDKGEISSSSIHSLDQYLSPTRFQLEGQGCSLRTFAGPAVVLSQQTWSSRTSQAFAACSLDSPGFQNPSSGLELCISLTKVLTNSRSFRKDIFLPFTCDYLLS
ncbi:LOW QUALITY PROTEIN: arginine-fifty homeobox [Urocitellus parryii]